MMVTMIGEKTAIRRKGPSRPIRELASRGVLKGRILDFGCGHGADAEWLGAEGYDPAHRPEYPEGQFDTVLCTYVLNVLPPEERAAVFERVFDLLNIGGQAFFTVRRDITSPTKGQGCTQYPVVLPSFYSFMHRKGLYEVYRVERYEVHRVERH